MTDFRSLAALAFEVVRCAGNRSLPCIDICAVRAKIAENMHDAGDCQGQYAEHSDEAYAPSKCQCQRMSYTNHHVRLSITA